MIVFENLLKLMKKSLFCTLVILAAAGLLCTSRPVAAAGRYTEAISSEGREIVKQERAVGRFSSLVSAGSTPVTYIQSSMSKVVIEGSPEFIDKMITEVRGGTLHIEMKRGNYRNLNLRVTVYSPVLDEVSMAGSGSFYDEKGHKTEGNVNYSSAGSGRISVGRLDCGSFNAHLSGSGKLSVDDLSCSEASLSASGSGGITVRRVVSSGDVSIRLAGSGYGLIDDADIGDLEIRISGSGSVKVNGRAMNVTASTSGSGSIMGDLKFLHLDTRVSGSGRVRF